MMYVVPPPPQPSVSRPTGFQIEDWLVKHLATELKLEASQIDPCRPFVDLGLDSVSAVAITGDLEQWLEIRVSPTLAWDYPTIRDLAAHLAGELSKAK